jgi:hypothetical protein
MHGHINVKYRVLFCDTVCIVSAVSKATEQLSSL